MAFRAVQADAGAIGGEGGTHEFMAIAESGEDIVVTCDSCDYAANLEKATSVIASKIKQRVHRHLGIPMRIQSRMLRIPYSSPRTIQ